MKLGQFRYNGDGELLEQNIEYTVYETESGVEAFPENSGEPVVMSKATFVTLQRGNLEQVDGYTPMR